MMVMWMLAAVLMSEPGAVSPPEAKMELRELLPGVRVGEGVIEFGGEVCADLSHPQTQVVYLELLVTGPDSREHESLVVTRVNPSAIHAGLRAAGLAPARPIRWEGTRVGEPARGAKVRVQVATVQDGQVQDFVDLASWAVHQETKQRLPDADGWGLVFAGSRMDDREGYAADETGTIIGLTGFGTEVIAAAWGLSPQAAVDEPVWIVDPERVPELGTPVVVRVIAADKPANKHEETPDPT